jgi:hypothetical protein
VKRPCLITYLIARITYSNPTIKRSEQAELSSNAALIASN